ncbi:putative glutamine-serine-proline rich protein [Aspergillus candidus]|uniref:CVNH domain-domain-containing protein n=1 Tax=Aspergillus candidus TaxID=41067 RepID=A0A2I2F2A8_ASPCN|nr:CVNH domain-domain-containing protein [Aspergillus candidus]PLB34775.1 CVNH domain-domain-containing protein [Aspergillus candidus]
MAAQSYYGNPTGAPFHPSPGDRPSGYPANPSPRPNDYPPQSGWGTPPPGNHGSPPPRQSYPPYAEGYNNYPPGRSNSPYQQQPPPGGQSWESTPRPFHNQQQPEPPRYYGGSPPPGSPYQNQQNQQGQPPQSYPSSYQGRNNNNNNHDGYPPRPTSASQNPQDDERGLMGAVAGGAGGAWAGHQVNHGILGTIGGALTGSVAEDAIKKQREKKHKEEEEERRRKEKEEQDRLHWERMQAEEQRHRMHANSHPLKGNFSASASDVALDGVTLSASCRALSGANRRSRISLDTVLSNTWGEFTWHRQGNFSSSARHVRLADGGRVLEAELSDGRGGWKQAWVRLDERITNRDGKLSFVN